MDIEELEESFNESTEESEQESLGRYCGYCTTYHPGDYCHHCQCYGHTEYDHDGEDEYSN